MKPVSSMMACDRSKRCISHCRVLVNSHKDSGTKHGKRAEWSSSVYGIGGQAFDKTRRIGLKYEENELLVSCGYMKTIS